MKRKKLTKLVMPGHGPGAVGDAEDVERSDRSAPSRGGKRGWLVHPAAAAPASMTGQHDRAGRKSGPKASRSGTERHIARARFSGNEIVAEGSDQQQDDHEEIMIVACMEKTMV